MTSVAESLLELRMASLARPGFQLGPINLSVRMIDPGSTTRSLTLLVGRSGSGKSTLLALAAGLLPPSTGQVLLAGRDLANLSESDRARIRRSTVAFAAQQPVFLADRTVGENVAIAAGRRGGRDARRLAANVLDAVGIGHLASRLPAFLSGGELARANVARALCGPAAIIVLDEPTAMLDAATADRIRSVLLNEAARRPLLVATHDEALLSDATAVVRLEEGTVVA